MVMSWADAAPANARLAPSATPASHIVFIAFSSSCGPLTSWSPRPRVLDRCHFVRFLPRGHLVIGRIVGSISGSVVLAVSMQSHGLEQGLRTAKFSPPQFSAVHHR